MTHKKRTSLFKTCVLMLTVIVMSLFRKNINLPALCDIREPPVTVFILSLYCYFDIMRSEVSSSFQVFIVVFSPEVQLVAEYQHLLHPLHVPG